MKNILFLFYILPFYTSAQNLNYSDLQNLLNKSLVESNDYIENKGYRVYKTNRVNNDNQIAYIWDKNEKINTTPSYLLIAFDKKENYKMVWYQHPTYTHFNLLKTHIEQLGFKLIDSYVKFESLYYTYESPKYNVELGKGDGVYTFSLRYNWDQILEGKIIPNY